MIGADHTLLNVLVNKLQQDKDVKIAAYNIEHPLVSTPKLIIETSKKTPEAVLADVIASLKEDNKAFLTAFEKSFQ